MSCNISACHAVCNWIDVCNGIFWLLHRCVIASSKWNQYFQWWYYIVLQKLPFLWFCFWFVRSQKYDLNDTLFASTTLQQPGVFFVSVNPHDWDLANILTYIFLLIIWFEIVHSYHNITVLQCTFNIFYFIASLYL